MDLQAKSFHPGFELLQVIRPVQEHVLNFYVWPADEVGRNMLESGDFRDRSMQVFQQGLFDLLGKPPIVQGQVAVGIDGENGNRIAISQVVESERALFNAHSGSPAAPPASSAKFLLVRWKIRWLRSS